VVHSHQVVTSRRCPSDWHCPSLIVESSSSDSKLIQTLYELDLPVVAAIPGVCMGAGLSLALVCDLRVCADTATFGAVFHRVGLSADFGLSWLLPQAVGASKAMHMLMTAAVSERRGSQDDWFGTLGGRGERVGAKRLLVGAKNWRVDRNWLRR
jgi:hypothetical protein